jgi:hypothetical protein
VTTSWKRKDIWQDLWESHWAGDDKRIARSSIIDSKNECQDIVDGLAPSKMEEQITHRVGAINVGSLTTLGTSGSINWWKVMVIQLDLLAPYQGTTRDKWH